MKIAVVGAGYAGLVTGTCFADVGVNITCVDVNKEKVAKLKDGIIPIYESGSGDLVKRNYEAGRLQFTTEPNSCLEDVEVIFSAVGTPPDEDECADLRFVVGVEGEKAKILMDKLYKPFALNNYCTIFTDILSAEMIKYAANAMLATRISFMNDIANLCEIVGADVNMVRQGIGSDSRIGNKFLYSGCGYEGSCFPKDVKALIKTVAQNDYDMQVLQAVEAVNEKQKTILFEKLSKYYKGDLKGKTIALWGLAFKPDTDDMREAPALVIIDLLLKAGCTVKVYDPIAMAESKRRIGDIVVYSKDMYDAAVDADALLLLTEWKEFRLPSWNVLKKTMNYLLIIDGRNIYDKAEIVKEGFEYKSVGG